MAPVFAMATNMKKTNMGLMADTGINTGTETIQRPMANNRVNAQCQIKHQKRLTSMDYI